MELVDLTEVFEATDFKAFAAAETVKGIRVEGAGDMGRSKLDALIDRAKSLGARGLVWMRVRDGGVLEAQVVKFLSDAEQLGIVDMLGARAGRPRADRRGGAGDGARGARAAPPRSRPSPRFAGPRVHVDRRLPVVRRARRRRAVRCPRITRSPRRTPTTSTGSSPIRSSVRSRSYDLVLNGWELGSGSVRIHRPDMQQRIFSLLGIDPEEAQKRFGFLLDAFRFGAPPHAGFAVGIDRLAAILAGEENIREVIVFPKTQSGVDPLTNAPTEIDASS